MHVDDVKHRQQDEVPSPSSSLLQPAWESSSPPIEFLSQLAAEFYDPSAQGIDVWLPFLDKWRGTPVVKAPDFGVSFYYSRLTDLEKKYYDEFVRLKPGDLKSIAEQKQSSEPWLNTRRWRFTSSDFAAFLGFLYRYMTQKRAIHKKIMGFDEEEKEEDHDKGMERMDWGKNLEEFARRKTIEWLLQETRRLLAECRKTGNRKFLLLGRPWYIPDAVWSKLQNEQALVDDELVEYTERGLVIFELVPMLGGSSDGKIKFLGVYVLLIFEFKCPAPKAKGEAPQVYALGKPYHLPQKQGNLFFEQSSPVCLYVSHTPALQTREIHIYDDELVRGFILPELVYLYFTRFFPGRVAEAERFKRDGPWPRPPPKQKRTRAKNGTATAKSRGKSKTKPKLSVATSNSKPQVDSSTNPFVLAAKRTRSSAEATAASYIREKSQSPKTP